MEAYKRHVIDQALTLLQARTTTSAACSPRPSCSKRCARRSSLKKLGITGVFCGGTEMTPQFHRFAVEELLEGVYFAPTYGNTLMGLATHKPRDPADNCAIIYYPPAPRAMIEVVDPDQPGRVVEYGADRPRAADDPHQGVLHAALPRARRGRARAALRALPVGRRAQRAAVLALPGTWSRASTDAAHPHPAPGRPYRSLDVARVPHYRTREPFVEVSQANSA